MSYRSIEWFNMILTLCSYKDWRIGASTGPEGEVYLQVRFEADGQQWGGRKWPLSAYMTKSEVVQTALKAVLTAEEHEARERFLYRDRAIFGPHLHVDALWDVSEHLDPRLNRLIEASEPLDVLVPNLDTIGTIAGPVPNRGTLLPTGGVEASPNCG